MELFNEAKNSSINKIVMAINYCLKFNSPIHRNSLTNDIRGNTILTEVESRTIDMLFSPVDTKEDFIEPSINSFFPIMPTNLELEWLTDMLNDYRINGLLSIELLSKLKSKLPNTNTICWEQLGWNNNPIPIHKYYNSKKYINTFRKCYNALLLKKQVYYESYDEYGNFYKGYASPYKIEYSIISNSFNFIMWNEEKSWTFKSDIATITNLQILESDVPKDIIQKANTYVDKMRNDTNAIILKLVEKNNALTRFFTLFAPFDKNITVEKNDTFLIHIYHRSHFDEEEIIQSILSLGSSVTVLAPETFREKIISYISESFSR